MTEQDLEAVHRARSIRTVAKKKGEWLANVKANAPFVVYDLTGLWQEQEGQDAVIVAAGPSLSEDLEAIKFWAGSSELIVVDAAAQYVFQKGLVPGYVVSTDSSDKIAKMIDGLGTGGETRLILNVIADPSVAKTWGGRINWYAMSNSIYDADEKEMLQYLHQKKTRVGVTLSTGGNVSSVALSFAMSVRNARKIRLFGHDFCWKDSMYVGGEMKDLEAARMTAEGQAGTIFEVKNTRGEKVTTNLSLQKYAEWHAGIIKGSRGRVENLTHSTIL